MRDPAVPTACRALPSKIVCRRALLRGCGDVGLDARGSRALASGRRRGPRGCGASRGWRGVGGFGCGDARTRWHGERARGPSFRTNSPTVAAGRRPRAWDGARPREVSVGAVALTVLAVFVGRIFKDGQGHAVCRPHHARLHGQPPQTPSRHHLQEEGAPRHPRDQEVRDVDDENLVSRRRPLARGSFVGHRAAQRLGRFSQSF